MAFTLDLINNTLALVGERPITTSTGSLGGIVRQALTTALYKVVQETRAQTFEQFLTFTATNDDYLVPIGSIPPTVAQFNKLQYRVVGDNRILTLKHQPLELLPYDRSYTIVGANVYLSPMFNRPITLFASVLNVPSLPADAVDSPVPDYLAGCVIHTAASILCLSYLDDPNASSLHRNIAAELIGIARLQFGSTRGREFNMGGWVV
jgi:hypothetical protein